MTKSSREPNFDRVARLYRWAEYLALGTLLQRTRVHFLPQLSACRHAWVLGDGDGRFLAALLAANQHTHATAVDTSASMLKLLHKRCSFAGERLQTVQASALTLAPSADTDVVITHFFLDCLQQSEVNTLVDRVAATCRPGTLWLVSDFQVPLNPWFRWPATAYIRLLYLAFRMLTGLRVQQLPDARTALCERGFQCIAYHETLAGMLCSELWQLTGTIE